MAAHLRSVLASGADLAAEPTEASKQCVEVLSSLRDRIQKLLKLESTTHELRKLADAVKHLVCLLELHALAHPATADPDLACDLLRVYDQKFEGDAVDDGEDSVFWADALVDAILSILARNEAPFPSAPLRDSAERAFRAFAPEVTPTGVGDLLRVVTKKIDEKDDAEEEEEEQKEGSEMDVDFDVDNGGSGSDKEEAESDDEADEALENGSDDETNNETGGEFEKVRNFEIFSNGVEQHKEPSFGLTSSNKTWSSCCFLHRILGAKMMSLMPRMNKCSKWIHNWLLILQR